MLKAKPPEKHDGTIEDKFKTSVTIENVSYVLNLLDTAGQTDYQVLLDGWIDYGQGFLLVFALNSKESFEALEAKKKRIDILKKNQKYPLVLVGNMCDLQDRKVDKKTAEDKAKEWGAIYIETSAKENVNCEQAFIECTKQFLVKKKKKKGGCNIL